MERIKLSASELVDLVEEQLSWLAIASTEQHHFDQKDFLRAESIIQIGPNVGARIDVEGVEAWDQTEFMALPDSVRRDRNRTDFTMLSEIGPKLMPHLGERFSYAKLTQHNPDELTHVWCGLDKRLKTTDFAYKDEPCLVTDLVGVTYSLRSIGMCSKSESDRWTRMGHQSVSGLKCFRFQEVVAFKDGRNASFSLGIPMRPDGVLLQLSTGKPLKVDDQQILDEDGYECDHPWNWEFGSFVLDQYERRDKWVIEVALSKDRTGVGLETDGAGALELVRRLHGTSDRRQRRGVMVHWVREHYRRRVAGGGESLVRGHLRGRTQVEAGGMWLTIWPARTDIERACNGPRFDAMKSE